MRRYERLAEQDRVLRRTVVDAIEVLRSIPDIAEQSRAVIRVNPLGLPSGEVVGMVDVEFDGPLPEMVCIVSLPTSGQFRAIRRGASQYECFDIFRLDGATVDGASNVRLADGTALRAVEMLPAHLPYESSALDLRIIRHTIALIRAKKRCYRHFRDGLEPQFRDMVPKHLRFLDCSKLSGLNVPPLKVIEAYIADHDPTLQPLSQQKIVDALRKFGIRVPIPRPRVTARRVFAAM